MPTNPINKEPKACVPPLLDKFPRIKLLWGDSHYAGEMITWLLQHLGWLVEVIRRPKDSSKVQETSDPDVTKEDKASASGFRPLRRQMGRRTQSGLDHPLAATLPRS